jgi:hypothetical protein
MQPVVVVMEDDISEACEFRETEVVAVACCWNW